MLNLAIHLMTTGYRPEQSIILCDVSRSTIRRDFKPNRLFLIKKAVEIYIEKKLSIDPRDQISIILMGPKPDIIQNLTSNLDSLLEKAHKIGNPDFSKIGGNYNSLIPALKDAFEILSARIRQIGGELYRILWITDNRNFSMNKELQNLIYKAKGLKISIDIALLQKENFIVKREEFLQITKQTGGEFGVFFNKKAFFRGIKGFASKKIVDESPSSFFSQEPQEDPKYYEEIAREMIIPNKSKIEDILKSKSSHPCIICLSDISPISNYNFKKTGRLCPNCGSPMHLYCAGKWSLKSKLAGNIFRCPYCYALLKVDSRIIKGLALKERKQKFKLKNNENFDDEKFYCKMIKVKMHNDNQKSNNQKNNKEVHNEINREIDKDYDIMKDSKTPSDLSNVCFYCFENLNNDALENSKIYRCSKCGATYHDNCLTLMYKKYKECINCGASIV